MAPENETSKILIDTVRELGYREFGSPDPVWAIFAHRELPVVIIPRDDELLTPQRLQRILSRLDMTDAEWRERLGAVKCTKRNAARCG